MREGIKAVVIAAVAVAPLFGGVAWADPSSAEFGEHVSHCAHEGTLDAEHNPGLHQGSFGWDGMDCHHR